MIKMENDRMHIDPKILENIPEEGYVKLPAMIGYKLGTNFPEDKKEELIRNGILPSCCWKWCGDISILKRGYPPGIYFGSFSTKLSHEDLKILGHDASVIGIYTDPDLKEEPIEVHIPEGRADLLFKE